MKIFAETERLILRELMAGDDVAMFEMDADPEVHKYVGKTPVTDISRTRDVITFVRQQYTDNGIGRWATVLKETGEFVGWAGLKLMKEPLEGYDTYYDLGYRLLRKHWSKGYATEAAVASVRYGFETLKLEEILARVNCDNTASRNVLEKAGLKYINTRHLDGELHNVLCIKKSEWEK